MNEWPDLPSEQFGTWTRLYSSMGLVSSLIIGYGLFSHFLKARLFLSEPLVAVLMGVACGPKGLDILFTNVNEVNLSDLARIFYHASRIVMAIQIMAAGISLPRAYVFRHWRSLLILLGPVMIIMWLTSSVIFYAVCYKFLTFTEALLLGACVTPTDPVLANSFIKGRFADEHVPQHLRTLLSAESGANDGAGLPLLFLPLLILHVGKPTTVISLWLTHVWLYQIVLSMIIGSVIGFLCRKALQNAEYYGLIDKESFLVFNLALAFALVGLVSLLGSNDMLAIFFAGVVFAWDDWFSEATREARIQEVIDSVFNLTFFVYLGTSIPWELFTPIGMGRLLGVSTLIMLFRRVPAMYFLRQYIPEASTVKESLFAGWFGPMGVGAIFYACMATMDWNNPYILPIVWFVVLVSVVVHGVTVPLCHFIMGSTTSFTRPPSPILPRRQVREPSTMGTEIKQLIQEARISQIQLSPNM